MSNAEEHLAELKRRARRVIGYESPFQIEGEVLTLSSGMADAVVDLINYLDLLDGACPVCGSADFCDCTVSLVLDV